jgi:hemerythrin-like domain-containing protein
MPTNAFEMALVHDVFRSQLKSVPELIRSVQPGQRGRLKRVARHIANVLAALHYHHMAEDELLWPKLHDRIPLHAEDIQRMETEHEFIAKTVVSVESRLAEWIAATDSTRQFAIQSRASEMLVAEIKALGELVSDHLGAEEQLVVPLINENMCDAEWRAVTERGGSFLTGRNMWFGLAFVGMALEVCTIDERRRFLTGMAPPQRLLVRLLARRAVTSYRARLGSARG